MAVLVVAVTAFVAVLPRFPRVGDALLLGLAGVAVLAGLGLAVNAAIRPVVPPAAPPGRWRDRDVTAAQKQVSRGRAVEPPELQTAAVLQARRGLRVRHLALVWASMMGCAWSLRIGEGGVADGLGYLGIVMMLLGFAGLGWSGVVQTRLDRLESPGVDAAAPTTDHHRLDGSRAER